MEVQVHFLVLAARVIVRYSPATILALVWVSLFFSIPRLHGTVRYSTVPPKWHMVVGSAGWLLRLLFCCSLFLLFVAGAPARVSAPEMRGGVV